MSKIEANKGVITQINVFTVAPENTEALIELLIEAANSVRDVPSWLSANIHRSLDNTRIVNYAQCESFEAWEKVMEKLKEGNFLEQNKKLAEASPGLYEVIYTIEISSSLNISETIENFCLQIFDPAKNALVLS